MAVAVRLVLGVGWKVGKEGRFKDYVGGATC